MASRPLPAIVVPVFNAADDVDRCLDSLAKWPGAPVILVDDASTDPRIGPRLAQFARSRTGVTRITAPENRGFIASVNRGAQAAPEACDLLVLNADTEVTAAALGEMVHVLERRPDAAICCPLSNNATFLSVPRYQQEAPLPHGIDAEEMAALLRDCASAGCEIEIPTAVGFCMLVRREAWRAWGPFDPAYGRGYGEDDELGQRVRAAGRNILCAPRAFVYHRGHSSFGASPEVARQRRANGALLASRWPRYASEVAAFCRANPLRPLHEQLWHALLSWPERRALHVVHLVREWPRSGPLRTRLLDLARATRSFANHTIVVPTVDVGAWVDAIDGEAERGVRTLGLVRAEQRFAAFLAASPARIVHFHGEDWRATGAVEIAHAAGRATMVTPEGGESIERCAEAYRRLGASVVAAP